MLVALVNLDVVVVVVVNEIDGFKVIKFSSAIA